MAHRTHKAEHSWRKSILEVAGAVGVAWTTASLLAHYLPIDEDLQPEQVAWPHTQFCRLGDRNIAYTDAPGDDPPVIFLHGFGANLHTWDRLLQQFADRHRIIAFDLWGFGASSRPSTLTPADWVVELLGLMDALQIENAIFVGHSLGGRVAMTCAAQSPQRARGVVLIDSDGAQLPEGFPVLWFLAHTPLGRTLFYRLRHHIGEFKQLIRNAYAEDFLISDELVSRYHVPLRVRGTQAAWLHLGRTYPGGDLLHLLPKICCPALLLWGANDRVTPVEDALPLIDGLPHAQMEILPKIGHSPQEECPELVVPHLTEFLAKHG